MSRNDVLVTVDWVQDHLGQPGIDAYREPDAGVPWLHKPSSGLFLSYDDPGSLALKKQYVLANGLGGVMIWEMSSDLDDQLLDALLAGAPVSALPALSPSALGLLAVLLACTARSPKRNAAADRKFKGPFWVR